MLRIIGSVVVLLISLLMIITSENAFVGLLGVLVFFVGWIMLILSIARKQHHGARKVMTTLIIVFAAVVATAQEPVELVTNGGGQIVNDANNAPMPVDISTIGQRVNVDQLPVKMKAAMGIPDKKSDISRSLSVAASSPSLVNYPPAPGVLVALAMPLSDEGGVRAFYLGMPGRGSYVAGRMRNIRGQYMDVATWYVQKDCEGCNIFMSLSDGPLLGDMRNEEIIFEVFIFNGTDISKIANSVVVNNNALPTVGPSIGLPWVDSVGEVVIPGDFQEPVIGINFWFLEHQFTINRANSYVAIPLPCGNHPQVITICDQGECGTVEAPRARYTATATSMPGQG